ncbi:MAG: zinc-dependent metalloprotease, partial [Thermomicrobiales bacterium]
IFAKITGLDLKLEQYRQGQRFIDTIVDLRGHDTAKAVWRGPDYLPTLDEIRTPELWLTRIDAMSEISA